MALVTITTDGGKPTLESAAEQLHVAIEDIDKVFGFVAVDAATNSYAVRVRADRLPAVDADDASYRGPFSDPRIEAFGGPKKQTKD